MPSQPVCPDCGAIVVTYHVNRSLYRWECTLCDWNRFYDALHSNIPNPPNDNSTTKES